MAALQGQDTGLFLGQLKTLFERGIEPAPSRNATVLESLRESLSPEPFSLFEAIWTAINDQASFALLCSLPEWKELHDLPLDAPWPETPSSNS